MHRKDPRESTRVHDRKIDREVCRRDLKKAGFHRPNKQVKNYWRGYTED